MISYKPYRSSLIISRMAASISSAPIIYTPKRSDAGS
jgi:hypothetical protein